MPRTPSVAMTKGFPGYQGEHLNKERQACLAFTTLTATEVKQIRE